MKQFTKTLALLGAGLFAVGCNNVTAQDKDTADAQAISAIKSGNKSTNSAAAMGTDGALIAGALTIGPTSGGSVAIDLNDGVPKPGSNLTKHFKTLPHSSQLLKWAKERRSGSDTVSWSGCVEPDADGNAVYYANGDNGCTAATYVQIDYVNGDEVQISFTDGNDFDFKVTKGDLTGTELNFKITPGTSDNDFTMVISGSLDQTTNGTKVVADKFSVTYEIAITSSAFTFNLSGFAEDDIKLKKVTYDDAFVITLALGQNTLSEKVDWTGNATVVNLQNSSGFPESSDGKVEYKNLKVTATISVDGNANTVSTGNTASGEIDFNGHKIGTISTDSSGNVIVKWTDNTTSTLDMDDFMSISAT